MENKIIDPLRAGYKTTLKIRVNYFNQRLIQFMWISSQQLIMWLSSVYSRCVPVCTHDNVWALSRGISSQTWIRASGSSLTGCGGTWQSKIHIYKTSHRCSIGFRSGERKDQSMASMCLLSRNCRNNLATWGRALSCRRNPEPTAPA